MAWVHVGLQLEHETAEFRPQRIDQPIGGPPGGGGLSQLQKGIEEGPHSEIGHRGAEEHRTEIAAVNRLQIQLGSRPATMVAVTDPRRATALAPAAAGAKGGCKLEPFENMDPGDWVTWRGIFEAHCDANGWDGQNSKLQLKAAVRGRAWHATRHAITDNQLRAPVEAAAAPAAGCLPDDPNRPFTLQNMLDAYEAQILSQRGTELAVAEFEKAQQNTTETIAGWHGRLQGIFLRAYPTLGEAERATNWTLIKKFMVGLRNAEVQVPALTGQRPATYGEALAICNRIDAGLLTLRLARKETKGSVSALAGVKRPYTAAGGNRGCFECGSHTHRKADCPKAKKWEPAAKRQSGGETASKDGGSKTPQTPYRGRGGRGRGRGGNRLNRKQALQKVLAALMDEEDNEEEPEVEEEDDQGLNALEGTQEEPEEPEIPEEGEDLNKIFYLDDDELHSD